MGGPSRDSLHLSGVGFVTFIGTYEEELLNCPWAGGGCQAESCVFGGSSY